MQILGCKYDNPRKLKSAFRHPCADYQVAVFLDICHMIKLIRNHWESKESFLFDDHKIDWSYGKKLPEQYINIIITIYANSKANIKLEALGREFRIKRGVRQGDPLSPKLFSAVLENVFRNLDWEHLGLNIDRKKLNYLRFADDLILLEECPKKLENTIQNQNTESAKVGQK